MSYIVPSTRVNREGKLRFLDAVPPFNSHKLRGVKATIWYSHMLIYWTLLLKSRIEPRPRPWTSCLGNQELTMCLWERDFNLEGASEYRQICAIVGPQAHEPWQKNLKLSKKAVTATSSGKQNIFAK